MSGKYSKPKVVWKMKTLADSTLLCFVAISVLSRYNKLAGRPKTEMNNNVADCQRRNLGDYPNYSDTYQ